jgi:glycolate oxidase
MVEFQTLQEIARAARATLGQNAWDYLTGGGESETTLKRNRLGLDSIGLRQHVCRDVTQIDASTELLGQTLRLPVCTAPMGSLELLEPVGAEGVVRAADEFGVTAFVSSLTKPEIEEMAPKTNRPMVYQIYVRGDDAWVARFVKRAVDAGCNAVCFTVDLALYGRRERDMMKRYRPPTRQAGDLAAFRFQTAWNWDNVKRFKDAHDIPLIIKGIATAEDAETAVELGVDVVYVSNHGGRQLDHGCATIDVLAEVAAAVGGKAKIMIDGGFMRGTDVVKAIALGAHAVGLGKLIGMGLAADGQHGVVRTLEILEEEITTTLGLMGVTRLDQLDPGFLRPAPPVVEPDLLSPYPFIDFTDKGY